MLRVPLKDVAGCSEDPWKIQTHLSTWFGGAVDCSKCPCKMLPFASRTPERCKLIFQCGLVELLAAPNAPETCCWLLQRTLKDANSSLWAVWWSCWLLQVPLEDVVACFADPWGDVDSLSRPWKSLLGKSKTLGTNFAGVLSFGFGDGERRELGQPTVLMFKLPKIAELYVA